MTRSCLVASAVLASACTAASADDFASLSDSFGVTSVLSGIPHATTNNPDGSAINFWTPSQEGALAVSSSLSNPHNSGADAFGNLYVADKSSHAILKITTDGRIHTFAGTHSDGFNGDGPATATSLRISNPNGLYVLPNGVVYLLDLGNHRIRRVSTSGVMTTVVNDPDPRWASSGRALWVSPDEQLIYYTHEYSPAIPGGLSDGACIKQWTPSAGISLVCSKAVGFRNPGNLAVHPINGKLYVTDRAEDDTSGLAQGVFRIDGPDQRTRITGNSSQPIAADGLPALFSYINQPRGITFLPDGSCFLCGHKDGSVWFMDTSGFLHLYLQGAGKKDTFALTNGLHPPLAGGNYFSQPRALTLAPNGDLLVVSNDSGFLFKVASVTPHLPSDLSARPSGDGRILLQWSGLFSRASRVQRSWSLASPDWQTIGAVPGMTQGAPSSFTDSISPAQPRAFYRLAPSL